MGNIPPALSALNTAEKIQKKAAKYDFDWKNQDDILLKIKEELSEVETKYQHLKAEFKQLQQQREEKDQHGLQLQSEINQVRALTFIYCTSSYGFFLCLMVI